MTKEDKYTSLLPQVKALCEGETDMIAKMANVAALLHHEFGFWWTGFYRVSPAYGEIQKSKNNTGFIDYSEAGRHELVLGTAWKERRTVVVPDVEEFPGHIACSSESRSEIVVPVFQGDEIVAVLDIDSRELATFDDTDRRYLEEVVKFIV